MPHWSIPNPSSDDPIADAAKAIVALQGQLDALFARPGGLTKHQIDSVDKHVKTFFAEFEEHVTQARGGASAG